jgi:hypothetical protein
VCRTGRRISGSANDEINEINEIRMNISRAFSCEWKEYIGREDMVLGIISELDVVCNLSSMRVLSVIASAGRSENEVAKHRAMRVIKESNKHIWALARGNPWVGARATLAFDNGWSSVSAWVPRMNVRGRFRNGI